MLVMNAWIELDGVNAHFVNDPTYANPIPQVVYAGSGLSVNDNPLYNSTLEWRGTNVMGFPVPGVNSAFFLCGGTLPNGYPILNTGPSPNTIIGFAQFDFGTDVSITGDLYHTYSFMDTISSWPGGGIGSITVRITGATFTGDPIYGILSDQPLRPPYRGEIFIINDPEIAGQTTATYTGDGTLSFPSASTLYITFMGGFTSSPTGSSITINGSSGLLLGIGANGYIYGLVNI